MRRKRSPSQTKWHWPYCGRNELKCRHNVGHGPHIHSCDGCCGTKAFDKAFEKFKAREAEARTFTSALDEYYERTPKLLTINLSTKISRKKGTEMTADKKPWQLEVLKRLVKNGRTDQVCPVASIDWAIDRIAELEKQVVSLESNPPFEALAEKLAKEKEALIKAARGMERFVTALSDGECVHQIDACSCELVGESAKQVLKEWAKAKKEYGGGK